MNFKIFIFFYVKVYKKKVISKFSSCFQENPFTDITFTHNSSPISCSFLRSLPEVSCPCQALAVLVSGHFPFPVFHNCTQERHWYHPVQHQTQDSFEYQKWGLSLQLVLHYTPNNSNDWYAKKTKWHYLTQAYYHKSKWHIMHYHAYPATGIPCEQIGYNAKETTNRLHPL